MRRLNVVGIGPGNPDYITPAAVKVINESDVIIGGTRNLSALDLVAGLDISRVEKFDITGRLDETKEFILKTIQNKRVTVIASGDPGFYGILGFLKKFMSPDEFNIVPGISSLQYISAKLGITWESLRLGSLHGRDEDILTMVSQGSAAFLTDPKMTVSAIAVRLCESGFGRRKMYAGCYLSYPDEIIHSGYVEDFIMKDIDSTLCVVVIADE